MASRFIRVDLNPAAKARLLAEARARGVAPEKMAARLLKDVLIQRSAVEGSMSVEEFRQMLGAMAEGSERLPNLPTEGFSRASFYEDRLDGRDAIPRR
jgi:hypothetical protein